MLKNFFHQIRSVNSSAGHTAPLWKQFVYTALLFCAGLAIGAAAKLLDLSAGMLADVFSQISVWVFLGTAIAVCSHTPVRASVNVFSFCFGMLLAYYAVALAAGVGFSKTYAYGWAMFALICSILAFFAWYARGKGWAAKGISFGILFFLAASTVLLFRRFRLSDAFFLVLTGCILLIRKKNAD